jgi:hypothetical protein
MTETTEQVVEIPQRNWEPIALRPVQWTETYAIDGDPKRGVMLTVLYTANRLAADAEVTLEATLIVRGEARATVVVPVTGLVNWHWDRLYTWADQTLMGIEAETRAQAVEAVKPVRKRGAKPAAKRVRKAPKEK